MARILGIDYGTKKLGIALSDEEQKIAFPKAVVSNQQKDIEQALTSLGVGADVVEIVVGLPVGLDGAETDLSREVRALAEKLKKTFTVTIYFENEVYSSAAVRTAAGEMQPALIDAASAAVILQSFLDRRGRPGMIK